MVELIEMPKKEYKRASEIIVPAKQPISTAMDRLKKIVCNEFKNVQIYNGILEPNTILLRDKNTKLLPALHIVKVIDLPEIPAEGIRGPECWYEEFRKNIEGIKTFHDHDLRLPYAINGFVNAYQINWYGRPIGYYGLLNNILILGNWTWHPHYVAIAFNWLWPIIAEKLNLQIVQ